MTVAAVTLLVSAAMCSISLIEGSDEAFGLEKVILTLCGAWLADSEHILSEHLWANTSCARR